MKMSVIITQDKPPNQSVTFVFSQDQDLNIALNERYEIAKCIEWIKTNNYSKVCLQFPDSYLSDSVDVTLLIEEKLSEKTYILGDTSYGSCCVDEVAAAHVQGDAIIHFGHACLTGNSTLPVLYVLPKRSLDLASLSDCPVKGPSIVVYDVGYHHISNNIRKCFPNANMIVPELLIDSTHHQDCSDSCSLKKTGSHSEVRYSRGFCFPEETPQNFIYLGSENDPCFTNFCYLFKSTEIWNYYDGIWNKINTLKMYKQLSYFTEVVKAAASLTAVVVSLSITGYLEAINYIKNLAKRWNKKVYVISIAKPNIAKLTNFPDMDVFITIGCPETHIINNKDIPQPVVSLMEVELALNENRGWDGVLSKDFKDIIPGGQDYIPYPETPPEDASNVSIITGTLSGQTINGDPKTTEISINANKSLVSTSAKMGGIRERTWFGLDQSLGETPVSLAVQGRSGTSTGYEGEPQ